jgi:hypothetical protein
MPLVELSDSVVNLLLISVGASLSLFQKEHWQGEEEKTRRSWDAEAEEKTKRNRDADTGSDEKKKKASTSRRWQPTTSLGSIVILILLFPRQLVPLLRVLTVV